MMRASFRVRDGIKKALMAFAESEVDGLRKATKEGLCWALKKEGSRLELKLNSARNA